jgi:hypothetical protein
MNQVFSQSIKDTKIVTVIINWFLLMPLNHLTTNIYLNPDFAVGIVMKGKKAIKTGG